MNGQAVNLLLLMPSELIISPVPPVEENFWVDQDGNQFIDQNGFQFVLKKGL